MTLDRNSIRFASIMHRLAWVFPLLISTQSVEGEHCAGAGITKPRETGEKETDLQHVSMTPSPWGEILTLQQTSWTAEGKPSKEGDGSLHGTLQTHQTLQKVSNHITVYGSILTFVFCHQHCEEFL